MNKRGAHYTVFVLVILFIFVIIFSAIILVPENTMTGKSIAALEAYGCFDSDEGGDIFTAGVVTYNEGDVVKKAYDECEGNTLIEYSCEKNYVVATEKACENVCVNGACV
ncbi:hypothetical protein KY326_03940 [Candidatus Woesearchaeota archaeon]|nr:hypothetical protein [Candidatus Woesearchaeota archaeon]